MTASPTHSVSVAAAIFDDAGENVLLIQRRDNGHWEPPGGILERGETIHGGLRREIREETGATIEIGPLTGIYRNTTRDIVALVFRGTLTSTPAPTTDEAQQVRWIPLSDINNLMDLLYSIRITDAHASEQVEVRNHDGDVLVQTSDHDGPFTAAYAKADKRLATRSEFENASRRFKSSRRIHLQRKPFRLRILRYNVIEGPEHAVMPSGVTACGIPASAIFLVRHHFHPAPYACTKCLRVTGIANDLPTSRKQI